MAPAPHGLFDDEVIRNTYDHDMYEPWFGEYYGQSDFANFGYWQADTRTPREACENLMEQCLARIPQKTGTILDVACGKGATTRHLLKYYPPSAVTGINISERQLQTCRANAPRCRFLLMDATAMTFAENTFDSIISIEAAFHFNTRERFLAEAYRVLKPGGRLVLTDVLIPKRLEVFSSMLSPDNHVPSPEAYGRLLAAMDFAEVDVTDVTEHSWRPWSRHFGEFVRNRLDRGQLDANERRALVTTQRFFSRAVQQYILAVGRKPPGTAP